ncbi:MAG: hypothetical protein ACRDDH_17250 [Cetobacterium sp.]|uniref:SMODS-associated NUDIX domain-containing protein n=1 Tax=Cetobacterium sp. TaxID=2071632 RepID=UPI003EE5F38C
MKTFALNIFTGLITNSVWAILGAFIMFIYTSRNNFKIKLKSLNLRYLHGQKYIRFSIAYLFKIKINGKYLLIKGERINQLQPIGGVYKYYDSFKNFIREWDIKDDSGFPIDETSKHDLRVRVPISYTLKMLQWFQTKKNREFCVFRELHEELLSYDFFKDKNLNNLSIEYIKTNIQPIKYSKHFKINEILIADIFEINLTQEQETIFKEFIQSNPSFQMVTEDEIERGAITLNNKSYPIGNHSKNLI